MQVPLSGPDITEKEINAVVEVLRSGVLSIGPRLEEFENKIATFVGVKHAIGVNSGTSGLHLAVRALGISDGDEVITTPLVSLLRAIAFCLKEQLRFLLT